MKPRIYLAGKISKNCWRHFLVHGLREHSWGSGDLEQDDWICTGPFFTSCDHGCSHQPNLHGVLTNQNGCGVTMTQQELVNHLKQAIDSSDAVFVYINSKDCFGTYHEVGYASAKGKQIYIVYGPDVDPKELWIQKTDATKAIEIVSINQLKREFELVKCMVSLGKMI